MATVVPPSNRGCADTRGPRGLRSWRSARIVAVPVDTVAQVLTDGARKPEWEGGLVRVVTFGVSPTRTALCRQPAHFWAYKVYHLPVFQPRDYVFHCQWVEGRTADGAAACTLTEQSATHATHPPVAGTVRGHVCAEYALVATDDAHTHVTLTVNLDPRGRFPWALAWLYGAVYPRLMLGRLRTQCLRVAAA